MDNSSNNQKLVNTIAVLAITICAVFLVIFEAASEGIALSRNCTRTTRGADIFLKLINGSVGHLVLPDNVSQKYA